VNEVSYIVNGETNILSTDGFCNHLVPEGEVQSEFIIKVNPEDDVQLVATVDEDIGFSEEADNISPAEFINDP